MLLPPSHPRATLTAALGSSPPGEDIPYTIFLMPYTSDSADHSWAMKHRATTNKTKGIFLPLKIIQFKSIFLTLCRAMCTSSGVFKIIVFVWFTKV